MGNSAIVKFTDNADSPSQPGQKSVVSAPFPETIKVEDLWDAFIEYCKYPVDPRLESVLKEVKVEETSSTDIFVKMLLDGKKLDRWGYGKGDGTDRVVHNARITFDWDTKEITTYTYKINCWAGEENRDTVTLISVTKIYKTDPPLEIEHWMEYKDDNPRRVSDAEASYIINNITNPIVSRLAKTKVPLNYDQTSPDGIAKSILSDSMDEHTTYDAFFPALIKYLKAPSDIKGEEVQEVSDTQFKKLIPEPNGGTIVITFDYSQESGEISATTSREGTTTQKLGRQIHKEPLRYEAWIINEEGERQHGRQAARHFQMEVNAALDAATSSSWFW